MLARNRQGVDHPGADVHIPVGALQRRPVAQQQRRGGAVLPGGDVRPDCRQGGAADGVQPPRRAGRAFADFRDAVRLAQVHFAADSLVEQVLAVVAFAGVARRPRRVDQAERLDLVAELQAVQGRRAGRLVARHGQPQRPRRGPPAVGGLDRRHVERHRVAGGVRDVGERVAGRAEATHGVVGQGAADAQQFRLRRQARAEVVGREVVAVLVVVRRREAAEEQRHRDRHGHRLDGEGPRDQRQRGDGECGVDAHAGVPVGGQPGGRRDGGQRQRCRRELAPPGQARAGRERVVRRIVRGR